LIPSAARFSAAAAVVNQFGRCGCVFDARIGTLLPGMQRRPSQILLILRGIVQGVPTAADGEPL